MRRHRIASTVSIASVASIALFVALPLALAPGCGDDPGHGAPASASDTTPPGDTSAPPDTDTPDTDTPSDAPDLIDDGHDAPPTPPPSPGGFFVWRGFHHEWLREVAGFRVPHRISLFASHLDEQVHTLDDDGTWRATAEFHFAQDTGVDGNYMRPEGHFAIARSPGLAVVHGTHRLQWTDDGDDSAYPRAITDLDAHLELDLDSAALGHGALDHYAALLAGLRLEVACDDAKQPPDSPCNSNGMWPYRIELSLAACEAADGLLRCPLTVHVHRAWTPNEGGLPPFESKPFSDRLDFDLSVFYTVLGGRSDQLATTRGPLLETQGRAYDIEPSQGTALVAGMPGDFPVATTALSAFGFEFSRPPESADDPSFEHLGRYILGWGFRVDDLDYNPSNATMLAGYSAQVRVPESVFDTVVTYRIQPMLVQLGPGSQTPSPDATVTSSLCSNSSEQAPGFSAWHECGSAETGPERTGSAVALP